MKAYKVFTSTLRPPVQGGPAVWDGTLPYELPEVEVDASSNDCGAGWNACRKLADALRNAGLWPDGSPSRAFEVETTHPVIERGDKLRAASWRIIRELSEAEIVDGIRDMSELLGSDLRDEVTEEQRLWREALSRPLRDDVAVARGLRQALEARGLPWKLKRFGSVRAARLDPWCHNTSSYSKVAWFSRASRNAWAATAAWDGKSPWYKTWDVMAAWSANDALIAWCFAHRGWIDYPTDLLTVGIREAYRHGLSIAIPTGPDEIGWEMA